MSDILYQCAKEFEKVSDYNYLFVAGKNGKTFQLNMSCLQENFTHIVGLDHLHDLDKLSSQNIKIKKYAFIEILTKTITYETISASNLIDVPFYGTYNSATNSEYTVTDRIKKMTSIESILDNAYKGKIIKWDKTNCNVIMPNGKYRNMRIEADYLLVVPSKTNKDENIYLFSYVDKDKTKDINKLVYLNVYSAFADCVDLTRGQKRPYTILQETKFNISTHEENQLFVLPSYQKRLEEEAITKALEADLSSISMLREDIHQNKEDSLDTYFDLRDTFSKSLDTKFKKKTAVKLLKEEYKKADNDEVKSLIQEEIDAIDKLDDSGSPTTMDFRQLPKSPQITVNPNGTVALSPSFHFQPPDFSQLGKKIKKAIKSILPKQKPKKQVHKKAASTAQKTAQKTSSATKSTTQKKAQDKPTEQKKEPVAVAASAPATKKEARMSMSAVKTVSKNIKKREASSKSVDDRQRSKNDIGIE